MRRDAASYLTGKYPTREKGLGGLDGGSGNAGRLFAASPWEVNADRARALGPVAFVALACAALLAMMFAGLLVTGGAS